MPALSEVEGAAQTGSFILHCGLQPAV